LPKKKSGRKKGRGKTNGETRELSGVDEGIAAMLRWGDNKAKGNEPRRTKAMGKKQSCRIIPSNKRKEKGFEEKKKGVEGLCRKRSVLWGGKGVPAVGENLWGKKTGSLQ